MSEARNSLDLVVGNCCMMCGKPATDAEDCSQWYSEGIFWVYCRACDCWTEHPVPAELRDISNARPHALPGNTEDRSR